MGVCPPGWVGFPGFFVTVNFCPSIPPSATYKHPYRILTAPIPQLSSLSASASSSSSPSLSSIIIHHHPSSSIIHHHHPLLSVIIRHHPLLSVIIRRHPSPARPSVTGPPRIGLSLLAACPHSSYFRPSCLAPPLCIIRLCPGHGSFHFFFAGPLSSHRAPDLFVAFSVTPIRPPFGKISKLVPPNKRSITEKKCFYRFGVGGHLCLRRREIHGYFLGGGGAKINQQSMKQVDFLIK